MLVHRLLRAIRFAAVALAMALPATADTSATRVFVRAPARSYSDANAPHRGSFLVASRDSIGPFFYRTVLLMLTVDPEGAVGLVINRPTELPVSALLPQVPELAERTDPAHFGGPVEPNHVIVLIESEDPPTESLQVIGNVFASRSLDSIQSMARTKGPLLRFRAYVGYAGWGPGQLDSEIQANGWLHVAPDEDLVFDESLDNKWERAIGKLGVDVSMLSGDAGHA